MGSFQYAFALRPETLNSARTIEDDSLLYDTRNARAFPPKHQFSFFFSSAKARKERPKKRCTRASKACPIDDREIIRFRRACSEHRNECSFTSICGCDGGTKRLTARTRFHSVSQGTWSSSTASTSFTVGAEGRKNKSRVSLLPLFIPSS